MLYLSMNNKNIITQTNRTILFEEINPEKPDLLTLIDEVKDMDSLSDERIIEINKYKIVNENWQSFFVKLV